MNSKDRIEIMKWNSSNFERLVLGCIDSYDSEKRRIFQDFSRSTRFLCLRTAKTSKFQWNIVKLFWRNEMKFHFIPILVDELGHFSAEFWWIFVRISRIFSENDEMSRDSQKKCPKNAGKGRKFRNWCQISFVHFIFSITSVLRVLPSFFARTSSRQCRGSLLLHRRNRKALVSLFPRIYD